MVARICQALALRGGERVLDVGTGSGYQAAVLAELADEVHTIERVPELAERARATLEEAGYDRVHVHVGDGTLGLPEHAPFDRDRRRRRRARAAADALRAARAARPARGAGRAARPPGARDRGAQPRGPGRDPLGAVPVRAAARRRGVSGRRRVGPRRPGLRAGRWYARPRDGAGSSRLRRRGARRRRADGAWAPAPAELAATGEVLRRRRDRLRRQPRRLLPARGACGRRLPARRRLLVRRRGDEQLHVEPRLDVPPPARARRDPGRALLRRSRCWRSRPTWSCSRCSSSSASASCSRRRWRSCS